jgi:hypothetical protein
VDLEQLGNLAGLTLNEVKEVTKPSPQPAGDPNADPNNPAPDPNNPAPTPDPSTTANAIKSRVAAQVMASFRAGDFGPGRCAKPWATTVRIGSSAPWSA